MSNLPKPRREWVINMIRKAAKNQKLEPQEWMIEVVSDAYAAGRYDEACAETIAMALD